MSGRVGALLAGGASRRYGRPKWRVPVGGRAMGVRALDALRPNVEAVLVVGDDPGLADLGAPLRPDHRPGRGPLGGLATALAWAAEAGAGRLLVLACDLPLVGSDTLAAVAAAAGDAEAAVPRTDGVPHPLCADYAVAVAPAVEAVLGGPDASLRALLATLTVRWLEGEALPGGKAAFTNVNDPAGRRHAEALLAGRGHPGGRRGG